MRFDFLVEDKSGAVAIKNLAAKIVGSAHEIHVRSYKGIGRIPKNLTNTQLVRSEYLLDDLKRTLAAYGRTYPESNPDNLSAVIVVCDLDDKCLNSFRQKLDQILNSCDPKPLTRFCIAIEEGEAWFLGDAQAVKAAYPRAKIAILNSYINDSICGTWECLADAIYKGGARALSQKGYQVVGREKSKWAKAISPHMDVHNNKSPSFMYFRCKLTELAGQNN